MNNNSEYRIFTLQNGIRVIHKPIDGIVAHCGFYINAGSRDELEQEQGIAHFIEHVVFKGTTKRKAYHILSRMEDVGGELNAYTAKEETCIYASFLNKHYERSIELLSDILFNSTFPEKELLKEKEVILDEINSYKDNPSDSIFDHFDELLYPNHPLGKNILGTPKNIKKFNQKDIHTFINRNYLNQDIIFCSLGNIDLKKLEKLCQKYIGEHDVKAGKKTRTPFNNYIQFNDIFKLSNYQSHCVIGGPAYSFMEENKKDALIVLNNLLGGPGMNSRLNLNIREKYGFCYNIESNYTPLTDTGVFSIYLGTDKNVLERSVNLTLNELKKLRDKKLGTIQLHKAKQQIIGQIAIAQQNTSGEMLSQGKSWMFFEKVDDINEVNQKINAITAETLQDIANEIFNDNNLSILIYIPK